MLTIEADNRLTIRIENSIVSLFFIVWQVRIQVCSFVHYSIDRLMRHISICLYRSLILSYHLLIYRYSYADILELLFQGFDVAALICLYS